VTVKALSPNVSVSSQISVEEAAAARHDGFRSIIGNRPDGEAPAQPSWAEIAAAAQAAGLETRHIPVSGNAIDEATVAEFALALETMPKPVLAYCGSGRRSAILWALSNNGSLTAEERIRTGKRAGFDFEPLRVRMEGPASGRE
jgi:sulfide:quinone oxidoreductase